MFTSEFDYDLPPDRIAQTPAERRDAARMMIVERSSHALSHKRVSDLPDVLRAGDLLVVNNTRVMPARLFATRCPTGGKVELLLLGRDRGQWTALARPARRLAVGDRLEVRSRRESDPTRLWADVLARGDDGTVRLKLDPDDPDRLDRFGHVPLPPYIRSPLADPDRYQTTYATATGSAAAPTAGLHLTPELFERFADRGVDVAEVTLHIGLDTFRPVTAARAEDHVIHSEWCAVSEATAARVLTAKRTCGRVVAIGTTTVRTLETLGARWEEGGKPGGFSGPTRLFIRPGYRWRVVDALLTNFHLPRTSLLMMICAFGGHELVMRAYREAIEAGYRFYSFGDAMFVA